MIGPESFLASMQLILANLTRKTFQALICW